MTAARALSPAAARVKRVVRQAIEHLGRIDGAAATTGLSRSHVHRWGSLNNPDLPCLDSALAIDEVLVAMGKGPMIVSALAFELGHVALDVCTGQDVGDIGFLTAAKALQSGEFMAQVARSMADGSFDPEEKSLSLAKLDECIAISMRLRAAIAEGAG